MYMYQENKSKYKQRTQLLKIADKSLVTAICECALNILNGNVPLTRTEKDKLYKERKHLRTLAKSRVSWKSKRSNILKKEEVIPLIIKPVLHALKDE